MALRSAHVMLAVGSVLLFSGACRGSLSQGKADELATGQSPSASTKHPSEEKTKSEHESDIDSDASVAESHASPSSTESSGSDADQDSESSSSSSNSSDESNDTTSDELTPAQKLVAQLDFDRFRRNIKTLAGFASRHFSQPGNVGAGDWIQKQLESFGFKVVRHAYSHGGQTRHNIYATKVGRSFPEEMYIVSAHMDSINFDSQGNVFAPGANDDASGTSLVLEVARVFAPAKVQPEISIRFILWNNEETGLNGSKAYAADRRDLQGKEEPLGSGLYPEPKWLGMIQHDMMMFDHGLPPKPEQDPNADVDIEYQKNSMRAQDSKALAENWLAGNNRYATDYPAEIGTKMSNTDSASFQDLCPSISVRENQRLAEIGNGSNPQWHRDTDVYETYSEADFRLGFNAAQTTTGALAEISNTVVYD